MEKPVSFAPNQDPETRRKILRHPDMQPLVLEIVRCTLEALHTGYHLHMMQLMSGPPTNERLQAAIGYLCALEGKADVIGAISDYVCNQGITNEQMAITLVRALGTKSYAESPVDLAQHGGTIASLVSDMLGSASRKN